MTLGGVPVPKPGLWPAGEASPTPGRAAVPTGLTLQLDLGDFAIALREGWME